MKYLEEIKEKLCKELEDYGRKSKLTVSDLEMVHKLTDTIKNIGKIEMQEEESGYSEARGGRGGGNRGGGRGGYSREGGEWEAMGSYEGGGSYARGRGRNARRDSMGRYSREGYSEEDYSEEGGSYRGGSSYARGGQGGGRGGYSRADAKEHMVKKIEGMMEEADPKERKALMECLEAIEEA